MKDLLINKKNHIFFIFQIVFCLFFFDSFFTYLMLFSLAVLSSLVAYMKNKFFEFYLIIFLMLIFIVYSILSVLYKNPNYYLKNRGIIEGHYIIEETKNRTRQMGSLTGRDSWIEPSSYESLTLRKKNSNILVLVECSITELACPFSNETNREVYVKYVESNFFQENLLFI